MDGREETLFEQIDPSSALINTSDAESLWAKRVL